MIQRMDVIERELGLYPQYYQDKYFGPNPKGRFIRWDDLPDKIKHEIEDCNGFEQLNK